MQRYSILWADDEIDLLKPHIMFLEKKGYDVTPVNSGADAIDKVSQQSFDIIFLDENMPGMTGLETLSYIKSSKPNQPVVMITKSEEEHIMEEAIGSKIADYLIKPLNPNQILLSVKKILDNKRLVSEKTNMNYQQEFRNISMMVSDSRDYQDWVEIYKKLVYWELEIMTADTGSMGEVLTMQKDEANSNFSKFIIDNYEDWLNDPKADKPLLSHQLMKKKVFPLLKEKEPVFFIVIDNLRYDQWKSIEPLVTEYLSVEEDDTYFSILPTTTAYARNAIFSGMMPDKMAKIYPDLWRGDDEDEGKNLYEEDFLKRQLKQNGLADTKFSYNKVIHTSQGKSVNDSLNNLLNNDLNVVVYNFVDMLSHARTEVEMLKELAPDESAYRSIAKSWFVHSPLFELLKRLSEKKCKVVISTDHGTIRVRRPFKIIGDRNVNTNLRYKQGKNLNWDGNHVLEARHPDKFGLPKLNVSTAYVFALEDHFFAYPNNYNYYVNYYRDTFQHGGISLEEIIIPVVTLGNK
ncbi:T9SS response regulator signal transducer PorX [Nafulsella turpanensis]|uniref:T9SS response regulator signal transducer PorX n=1 Tax=Nafulsella turpanensis TaxID=1265690 RepID=UPI0003484636|nr:bifunctional response regulator/alkaline phosphatase family protein [Nafulsella turpanensis]